jgi:hypothetical protein
MWRGAPRHMPANEFAIPRNREAASHPVHGRTTDRERRFIGGSKRDAIRGVGRVDRFTSART